jgi:predicted nucleotidyltransferase
MIKASLQTTNFDFVAYGQTVNHAKKALLRGLVAHGNQYGLDNDWFKHWENDIQTMHFDQCVCYRDNEYIKGQKDATN